MYKFLYVTVYTSNVPWFDEMQPLLCSICHGLVAPCKQGLYLDFKVPNIDKTQRRYVCSKRRHELPSFPRKNCFPLFARWLALLFERSQRKMFSKCALRDTFREFVNAVTRQQSLREDPNYNSQIWNETDDADGNYVILRIYLRT